MKQLLLFLFVFTGFSAFCQKPKKAVNIAAIPIVSYNKSFGAQIGIMTNAYYNVDKSDTISPVSVVGVMGSYFMNGT